MSTPVVWMPLNGSLKNQGTGAVTVTSSTTPSFYDNGKTGKAYNLNVRTNYNCPALNGADSFTMCFWIKTLTHATGTGNWQDILGFTDKNTSGTTGQFRFESGYGNAAYGGCHWHDNATNAIYNGSFTYFSEREVWHHCAVAVKKNTFVKSYTDGVLRSTLTAANNFGGGSLTGVFWIEETGKIEGAISDLRVYDTVLSDNEIRQISKGLVIHYPLDGNGLGGLNEMPNAIEMPYGSSSAALGRWRGAGSSSMTKKRVYLDSSPVGPCYAFQNSGVQTPNDGSCWGIDSFPREPNMDYCISAWARITEGTEGYVGFNVYGATYVDGFDLVDKNYRVTQLPADGSWKRVYCHVKTGSGTTGNLYIGTTTGDTSVTTQMCAIKLEKGSVPTDWSPAAADMPGYDETKVYDISGFRNDGTIVDATALSVSIDAIRYRTSTEFDGVTGCVLIPFDANLWQTNFSMSIWFKKFDIGSKNYETLIGGKSGFEMDTRAGASTTLALYMTSTRGGTVWSPFEMNKWYMVTLVNDGTNEFYYINGSLVKTIDKKAMPIGQYYLGSWNGVAGQNFKGYMSDFRVYATALSSSDVKDLYQAGRVVRT